MHTVVGTCVPYLTSTPCGRPCSSQATAAAHKAAGQALDCRDMPPIAVPLASQSVQASCAVQLYPEVPPCEVSTTPEHNRVLLSSAA